ncbi:MAG: tetratricopeptide repeat protein [Myxococcota bacterium]
MSSTARGRDPAVEEEFLGALYKGGELLAAGKIDEARAHLEKAHELQPKNEKAQNLLGLTYFKLGHFEDAARIYELLVRENPVDPTLRVNLGLVYLKTNNLERSIKEFETATDLEPTHQKAHNYLGLALAQAGEYAKAREHFHQAGSEAMAEKMTRALVARAEAAADEGPGMVVTTGPARAQAVTNAPAVPISAPRPPAEAVAPPPVPEPPAPPVADTDTGGTWDVMSDEEVPSDAYVMPEDVVEEAPPPPAAPAPAPSPRLDSDWGAQFEPGNAQASPAPAPAPAPPAEEEEMRFAEDEGPSASTLSSPGLPAVSSDSMPVLDASAVEVEVVSTESTQPEPAQAPPPRASPSGAPAWLTMEAAEAANSSGETQWVTEGLSDVPLPPEQPGVVEAEVSWGGAEASVSDASWATGEAPAPGDAAASAEAWATSEAGPPAESVAMADDASWATGETVPPASAQTPAGEAGTSGTPTSADAGEWATAEAGGVAAGATWETGADGYQGGPIPPIEMPEPPAAEIPPPNPSGPDLPIDVAHPEPGGALPSAEVAAGYTAMRSQRLVDLGAASGWVTEPSGGPFHLSPEGLAVKVSGEVLSRMTGLVAVVGGLEVKPEVRRKRGKPSQEPFGEGPMQLQRLSGNGFVYLEPGKHRFFAVDLTDTNGASVDDDGAYVREETVFAFEEPVSFENGRITGEGLALDLVHLKGTGKALLQLEGTMKAMPIPPGAPMVVPLKRLVGWFGRVTPRLMGFGGQGAVELKGDGYALLETPGERS